jgi:hypothetical protein
MMRRHQRHNRLGEEAPEQGRRMPWWDWAIIVRKGDYFF